VSVRLSQRPTEAPAISYDAAAPLVDEHSMAAPTREEVPQSVAWSETVALPIPRFPTAPYGMLVLGLASAVLHHRVA